MTWPPYKLHTFQLMLLPAHIPKSNSQETFSLTRIYNNLNTARVPTCYLPFHETFQPQRVHVIQTFRQTTPPSILVHLHLVRNDRLTKWTKNLQGIKDN